MDGRPAFAGSSPAYAEIHLAGAVCLDGRVHDGQPCLLNDDTRRAEALHLLTHVPEAAHGEGVVLDPDGRPVIRS